MKNKRLMIAGCLFLLPAIFFSQVSPGTDTGAVHSIDGIVAEMLRSISREKGAGWEPDHFRQLFLPTARFTILNHDDDFPEPAETVTLDEFITILQDPYYEEGFTEYETGKVVEEYNGIAQVFQSFYARDSEGEEGRGMTSYQLVYFDDRWWIANLVWTTDSNGVPIPSRYLQPDER